MKSYKNYIFDFYGTLVDIETNENSSLLWKRMAEIYTHYGAPYTGVGLRKRYQEIVKEEEKKLAEETFCTFPEIRLENVFARLLHEGGASMENVYGRHDQGRIDAETGSDYDENTWIDLIANVFRIFSRKRLLPYPGTIETLEKLKKRGCRLYILSNAQRVFTMPEMEITGMAGLMDAIYISSDYSVKKPDPAFIGRLIREQHLDPTETVMVGNDCESDIGSAKAALVDGVLLNTFRYDDDYIKKHCPIQPAVITQIEELL